MPRIPGIREEISTNVPSRKAVNSGGQFSKALQNLGGTFSNISQDISARRKKAQDLSDYHDKLFQIEQEWNETDRQLKADLNRDGTLRQDKYGTDEKGRPFQYSEVVQEFWDSAIPRYTESMVSDEATQMFLRDARSNQKRTSIKADALQFNMEVKYRDEKFLQDVQDVSKSIANQTEIDFETITGQYERLSQRLANEYNEGYMNKENFSVRHDELKQNLAKAILGNMETEGNWSDMLYFLDAGSKPKREFFELVDGQMTRKFKGKMTDLTLLPEDERKDMERRTGQKFKGNDFLGNEYEWIAGTLTSDQIKQWKDKALRESRKDTIVSKRALMKDLSALKEQAYSMQVDLTEGASKQNFRIKLNQIRNLNFEGNRGEKARILMDMFTTYFVNDTMGDFPKMPSGVRQRSLENFKKLPSEDIINRVSTEFPELETEVESLKKQTPSTLRKIKNDALASLSKFDAQIRKQYMNDFAGFILSPQGANDSQARKALSNRDYTKYKERLIKIREEQGLPQNVNAVPKAALNKFKANFTAPNTTARDKKNIFLDEMRSWGPLWSEVQAEYSSMDGIPSSLKAASMLRDTNAIEDIFELTDPEKSQGLKNLTKDLASDSDISAEISDNETWQQFSKSMVLMDKGTDRSLTGITSSFKDVVALKARDYINQDNSMDIDDAVEKASESILTTSFDLVEGDDSSVYIPKGMNVDSGVVESFINLYSETDSLKKYFKPPKEYINNMKSKKEFEGLSDEKISETYYNRLENSGKWVTSPDNTGLMYIVTDPSNGQDYRITDKDGNAVFEWNRISGDKEALLESEGFFQMLGEGLR